MDNSPKLFESIKGGEEKAKELFASAIAKLKSNENIQAMFTQYLDYSYGDCWHPQWGNNALLTFVTLSPKNRKSLFPSISDEEAQVLDIVFQNREASKAILGDSIDGLFEREDASESSWGENFANYIKDGGVFFSC